MLKRKKQQIKRRNRPVNIMYIFNKKVHKEPRRKEHLVPEDNTNKTKGEELLPYRTNTHTDTHTETVCLSVPQ